jgi:hypothetical protein
MQPFLPLTASFFLLLGPIWSNSGLFCSESGQMDSERRRGCIGGGNWNNFEHAIFWMCDCMYACMYVWLYVGVFIRWQKWLVSYIYIYIHVCVFVLYIGLLIFWFRENHFSREYISSTHTYPMCMATHTYGYTCIWLHIHITTYQDTKNHETLN